MKGDAERAGMGRNLLRPWITSQPWKAARKDPDSVCTHIWEVVLIENRPVGVTCKMCDECRQLGAPETPESEQVFDVSTHKKITLEANGIQTKNLVVKDVYLRSDWEGTEIQVTFRQFRN